jgi:hypothetical protein
MNLPVANQPRPPEKPIAATRFQFATGDRPLSGYTIKRGVGRGGFGEVYFAVSDGGKEVALKLIRRNLDVELRGVQHCLNLKHPNLIALYDVRRDGADDDCWIVMEYVAGESLEGAIRRHPAGMPADEAVDWLRGIAAGAAYLHNHGIVHRDLKPGNVFRDESLVKLGDYGLSKFISCSRRSGQTESVGTVHYMAPEIAHGRYGREIDIYALGVILYEMLTGRVPFDGESVGEVLMKHLTAQPDVSVVPAAYRPVVARALAKDPALRFSSIEQFLAALPGAGQGPAAQAPAQYAAAAARPESYHAGNSAGPRVEPPARPAALDPVPPGRVLWALSIVLMLVVVVPPVLAYARVFGGRTFPMDSLAYATLCGLAVYFLATVYFLAKRRPRWKAGQLPGDQHWPATSDVPPPLPPMPSRESTDGFSPAVAGILSAVLAGLVLPLLICFALDFATNIPVLVDVVRPIQDGIRREGARSKVIVAITLGLIGGFASYLAASSRGAPRRSNRLADLLHPAFLAVGSLVLVLIAWTQLRYIIGEELPPVGTWFTFAWAAYFLLKWWARSRAGNRPGLVSTGRPPLSPAAAPPPSAFRSAAYSIGRAVGLASERATPALVVKSPRHRLAELLESLVVSAAVSIVLAVIAAACQRGESGPEEVAWYALTGTLGAWAVLVLSKPWEGTRGEPILRRFAMLVVGLGVGAGSCGLDRLLLVRLSFNQSIRPARWHVDWDFYNRLDGAPHLEAYLAYFGLMFFLIPWWRQAGPFRASRLSFTSLAWALMVALSLNLICPFPQPWGAIVALIISLSVQLACPTVAQSYRWATGGKNG